MAGSEESYTLAIEDNEEARIKIGDVYKKIYGNTLPRNLCAYEISMTDIGLQTPSAPWVLSLASPLVALYSIL